MPENALRSLRAQRNQEPPLRQVTSK
jgi:hypothetical protein